MVAEAVRVAREMAQKRDPLDIARDTGARFEGTADGGVFSLPFLGGEVALTWPALEVAEGTQPIPDHVLALLLYYLGISDGAEPTGEAVSFADLPDGRFYVTAFRGYTAALLGRRFAHEVDALELAVAALGGVPLVSAADRGWWIPALPRVPVTLLWWDADEEFDARAELLFDKTASHHLTTDGCAVLGSWLTSMLRR